MYPLLPRPTSSITRREVAETMGIPTGESRLSMSDASLFDLGEAKHCHACSRWMAQRLPPAVFCQSVRTYAAPRSTAPGKSDWEAVQRGGLQAGAGPVHAALRRAPLCLAFGAGQRSQAVTLANKLYFVSRYAPRVIDASGANFVGDRWDLPGECASANLLLIGSPSENAWTSRFSCAFPYLQFVRPESNDAGHVRAYACCESTTAQVFDLVFSQTVDAASIRLLAVGPLPSRKLALLVYGTDEKGLAQAVAAVPVTSGRHGADFLVLGPSAAWKGEGGILAAGYLTPLWQISSSGWAEPEHPFEGGGGLGSTPAAHCSVEMEATKSDVDLEGNFWPRSGGSVQRLAAAVAAVAVLGQI
eukprot:s1101_g6.t1